MFGHSPHNIPTGDPIDSHGRIARERIQERELLRVATENLDERCLASCPTLRLRLAGYGGRITSLQANVPVNDGQAIRHAENVAWVLASAGCQGPTKENITVNAPGGSGESDYDFSLPVDICQAMSVIPPEDMTE